MKYLHAMALAAGICLATGSAFAAPPIPLPADKPFSGVIKLSVDARDTARGVFAVHETIPMAKAGPLTLLYPEWIPGWHAPEGTIDKFAGLKITSNGKPVTWKRDPLNVFAFHVDAPAGDLDIDFQFLSPVAGKQGAVLMTPDAVLVEWQSVVLYPAGHAAPRIQFAPSLTLPAGFQFGGALETQSSANGVTVFKQTDLDTLADSPILAGRYFKRVDLAPGDEVPVFADIVADEPEALEIKDDQLAAHRNLVKQAYALFGSHHYNHYDFLLGLSDKLDGQGTEHHRSSENVTLLDYFTGWNDTTAERDLLAHEFVHSWNGKFRRGADLLTPNFNVPMQNSLLWVYEGQTQFWGYVLAARSGLWSKEQALDGLAATAALQSTRAGRAWRPLLDTTNEEIISRRSPQPWPSQQRTEDYYDEGQLIWLDIDMRIREKSQGRKSLDDFARAFFGVDDGSWTPKPYVFDDVVKALNAVQPNDWAAYLHGRLDRTGTNPLEGLERTGYRLVYTETEGDYLKSYDHNRKRTNFAYSLGLVMGEGTQVNEVMWGGPAYEQGLTSGSEIIAVNGVAYTVERLQRAITAAKTATKPIELLVKSGDTYRTIAIAYHGGLRYPHFERIPGTPDRLGDLLAPK
jgi:predicted metalloprotease with PDZ domain